MLYEEEFLAQLPPAGPHERSPLISLRTHRPRVLGRLNQWFGELYPGGHADLAARLRNLAPSQFTPAFYELILHKYFADREWQPLRNHTVNGGNPDFYLPPIDWFAEVATISESQDEERESRELDDLCRMLEQIQSPFWISVFDFAFANIPIDKRRIVAWVEEAIRNNSHEKEFPARYEADQGQTTIDFHFDRKGANARANVGAKGMFSLDFQGQRRRILARLRAKARKYDRDILLFICSGEGFWAIHHETVDECLYGDRIMVFNRRTLQAREDRRRNGFFTRIVHKEPQNTRVAAVILCQRRIVDAEDTIGIKLAVHHNPYTRRRLDATLFEDNAQFVITSDEDGRITMAWINEGAGPVTLG